VESEILLERLPSLAQAPSRAIVRSIPAGLLLAVALVLAWLLVAPSSPDLAAQAYRTRLFEEVGFTLWDNNWYGGHHLPGYSLLYPWAALLLGMRLVGGLAVLASVWAFERVALNVYGARARWAAPCFALAAAGDLWIGRLTFALGVAFALLAVLALLRGRVPLAAGLALLCAASSPVAGLLLAFAGVTHMLCERRLRSGAALVGPALAVVLPLQALFPEGGWEPFAASSVLATLAVTLAFVYALPREERLLRVGGLLYAPVTLLSLIHTPMGSNVERYAVLFAAPMLLCGCSRSGWSAPRRPLALVVVSLCGILVWTMWGPIRQTAQVLGDPSTNPSFYRPLLRFLANHVREPVRIEVPFTSSHWDAALLAPYVPLARGWERQLDKRFNTSIEADPLSPSVYHEWLQRNAISYVALPDVRLDGSSLGERVLIRRGVPYLREVLHTTRWRVFAVLGSTPLASSPGWLVQLGHDSFTLRFSRAGTSLVRVRYTRYWTLLDGAGCVRPGTDGWTAVSAPRAGVVRVAARFSLERALGLGGACS
jgi:hypothetical protein